MAQQRPAFPNLSETLMYKAAVLDFLRHVPDTSAGQIGRACCMSVQIGLVVNQREHESLPNAVAPLGSDLRPLLAW